jgi:perosamine synthetase
MIKDIRQVTLHKNNTIKEAMHVVDKTGMGIIIINGENETLAGVATDGDIRRALLDQKNLDTPLKEVMNPNPVTALEDTPVTDLLQIMLDKGIYQIPIVDQHHTVVDVVFLRDLKSIPLSNPDITQKEVDLINQVLSTPYLSIGPKIKEFEENIAKYIGTRYAVAVNSGTSALHLCIRSLEIKDGDEVITSPFSFISSANCMLFERARPVFVDIDKNTLCLDADRIEERINSRTKAILPVHIFGYPCRMDKIMEIAEQHHLAVIEDACEAIGAEYKGKKVGTFGNCGVFAFYPNKQITTAEGGMIATDDERIAQLCRSMRNQGRDEGDEWLSYTRLGYNYRMNELSASLGVAQLGRIDEILIKRQNVAESYNKRLRKIPGIIIPYSSPDVKISWFVYVVRLDEQKFSRADRDRTIHKLRERGIDCRDYFSPIHLQPFYVDMFGYRTGDFPVTEEVSGLTIALPFHNNLQETEIEYICNTLENLISNRSQA